MKSRKRTHKKKNKFVIGLVSLSMMTVLTMNVSFADEDIQAKLQHWYETKSQSALKVIDQAVNTEVELQKERLRKEVQLKMAKSAAEMDIFTKKQLEVHINEVRNHGDQLIDQIQFSNEEEKTALLQQLSSIQKKAEDEMTALANDFETAPPPPVADPSADSVKGEVAKQPEATALPEKPAAEQDQKVSKPE